MRRRIGNKDALAPQILERPFNPSLFHNQLSASTSGPSGTHNGTSYRGLYCCSCAEIVVVVVDVAIELFGNVQHSDWHAPYFAQVAAL